MGDPLRYVGVVLLLGVTPLQHPLLARQGFYTVDGTHRLFTMPYEPLEQGSPHAPPEQGSPPEQAGGTGGGTGGADGAGGGGVGGGGGAHSTMWQLSIALPDEASAVALCGAGGAALLAEATRRTAAWHTPVPQMLAATAAASVWGTPLYDRAALPVRGRQREVASGAPFFSRVTLLGDAG